jgi:hypothetical protein
MDANQLYELLPAIYRLRDAEQGEPLRALLGVIAEQAAGLEESLAQMYDDWFIETAAPWVVPYIGDLIGYRGVNLDASPALGTPRSEVANTIGYRRRKGTAAMLEQLGRDATGWDAAVVEFFQRLATPQYMNHIRPENLVSTHLGRVEELETIDTPFDRARHTTDVRRIASRRGARSAAGRGKYNIPNIGIFLWRIGEQLLSRSPAVPLDKGRYHFLPLDVDAALYNDALPVPDFAGLATPANVPQPITRRGMARRPGDYYGPDKSLLVELHPLKGGKFDPAGETRAVAVEDIVVCDLSDVAGGGGTKWAHLPVPAGKVAIDPALGRLAFGTPPKDMVLVTFRYGFPAEIGGGEYERGGTFQEKLRPVTPISMPGPLQDALVALAPGGAVQIQDSGRYEETLALSLDDGSHAEIRARNGSRPAIVLGAEWKIDGGEGSELTLNGLLITGAGLRVTGMLARLNILHCTLTGELVVDAPGVRVQLQSSITAGLRVHEQSAVTVENSIIDAGSVTNWAYSGLAANPGDEAGGPLTVIGSTVIGRAWASEMPLASNAIFDARLPEGTPATPVVYPVRVDQRQEGCVRFSYVPPGSRTPRRHQCQPAEGVDPGRVQPEFTSLRLADAAYSQLSLRGPVEIATGADDSGEMGAYHHLLAQQRVANLRVRLDEYLRFGLEAGIFFVS